VAVSFGRSRSDFGHLSAGELKLMVACKFGERFQPEYESDKRVRSTFVRFLVLGGDETTPVHENGVRLSGCTLEGDLNFLGCQGERRLVAQNCILDGYFEASGARLRRLNLDNTKIVGVERNSQAREAFAADDCHFVDGLSLERVVANGEIRIENSEVFGNILLSGSTIKNPNHLDDRGIFKNRGIYALNLDGTTVHGTLVIDNGFKSFGEVRMLGARIHGDINFHDGSFMNLNGDAISCDRLIVQGAFFFRNILKIEGDIRLNSAVISTLSDDWCSWNMAKSISMEGFKFSRIGGRSPIDWEMRAKWLKKQPPDHFALQPCAMIINILKESGHTENAKKLIVAIERHKRSMSDIQNKLIGQRNEQTESIFRNFIHKNLNKISVAKHIFLDYVTGFGYRPMWTILWALGIVLIFGEVFYVESGHFGPTNPLIYNYNSLSQCGPVGDLGKLAWTDCRLPPEYTTFQPFVYSLDLFLPLVDLQQDRDWAPIISRSSGEMIWDGWWIRILMWLEIGIGWMFSLIFVAYITRFAAKE
jgi:hypothetical protein